MPHSRVTEEVHAGLEHARCVELVLGSNGRVCLAEDCGLDCRVIVIRLRGILLVGALEELDEPLDLLGTDRTKRLDYVGAITDVPTA